MTVEAISTTFGLAFLLVWCLSAQIMIRGTHRPHTKGTGVVSAPSAPKRQPNNVGLRRAG